MVGRDSSRSRRGAALSWARQRLSLQPNACYGHSNAVSESDIRPVVIFPESSQAFLSSRPEWTVNGALLKTSDGRAARVTQSTFIWVDGAWEATVTILPIEASQGTRTLELKVRVTPDTLRRWHDVGINPFLEASAQLQEFWRTAKPKAGQLTWL